MSLFAFPLAIHESTSCSRPVTELLTLLFRCMPLFKGLLLLSVIRLTPSRMRLSPRPRNALIDIETHASQRFSPTATCTPRIRFLLVHGHDRRETESGNAHVLRTSPSALVQTVARPGGQPQPSDHAQERSIPLPRSVQPDTIRHNQSPEDFGIIRPTVCGPT